MTYFKDGKVIGISETQTTSDNSTKIATTAYADNAAYFARPLQIPALAIDWAVAEVFWKEVSADSTFTFSNLPTSKTILVIIKNTGASTYTMSFPTALKDATHTGTIAAGSEVVYTFIRNNSKTYLVESANLV